MLRLAEQLSTPRVVRPTETRVLMAEPTFFQVESVINPFMEHHVGAVDPIEARSQWEALKAVYERLGFEVHTLQGAPNLPDLVFMANQSFPVFSQTDPFSVLLSNMCAPERAGEVAWVAQWYQEHGFSTKPIATEAVFEGMGDCLWVPNTYTVMAGYGFRTQQAAVAHLSETLLARVIPLQLIHPSFYHLDTCLSPIDSQRAFFVPEAFDTDSIARLRRQFTTLIPIPIDEAIRFLACNGHCPDGKHFIVQEGAVQTVALAQQEGLIVEEVNTSEFLKSGGSVYCMKLMLP